MNKENLFAFADELNKLYEKFGLYIDTDGSSETCFIEPDNGDTVMIVFDKEKKKYTLWSSKLDPEQGRVWSEVKKGVSFPKSDWSKGKIEGFSIMYEGDGE